MRTLITCSLLTIAFFVSSCRDYQELQLTGVKGFKINTINTKGIDGDILIGIHNPNRFGFSIYKSVFDVKYSGVYLGKAKLSKRVHIKANQEETYAFNLTGDFTNVNLMDVMKLLNGTSFKNTVEVKGDLKAGKLFIKKRIPVDLKESLKLQ